MAGHETWVLVLYVVLRRSATSAVEKGCCVRKSHARRIAPNPHVRPMRSTPGRLGEVKRKFSFFLAAARRRAARNSCGRSWKVQHSNLLVNVRECDPSVLLVLAWSRSQMGASPNVAPIILALGTTSRYCGVCHPECREGTARQDISCGEGAATFFTVFLDPLFSPPCGKIIRNKCWKTSVETNPGNTFSENIFGQKKSVFL